MRTRPRARAAHAICATSPVHIWDGLNRPSASSTGKPIIHRKGRVAAMDCTQAGKSESGAICPERKSIATKYSWLKALTRVVQKAARASVHSNRNLRRYASASAGRAAAKAQGATENAGRKSSERTTAVRSIQGNERILEETLSAMSEWIGCTGRSRANDRLPWRTRYSYSYMIQV